MDILIFPEKDNPDNLWHFLVQWFNSTDSCPSPGEGLRERIGSAEKVDSSQRLVILCSMDILTPHHRFLSLFWRGIKGEDSMLLS
jgi:hypothetical protein